MFFAPSRIMRCVAARDLQPLINLEAWNRIASVAEEFAAPVHTVCFECRLSKQDDAVDFAVSLFPGVDTEHVALQLQKLRERDPAWDLACEFLEGWHSLKSGRSREIPFVCVAFDLAGPTLGALPLPCLSFCVDPHFFARRLGMPAPAMTPASLLTLASDCYREVSGRALLQTARNTLQLYLDAHLVAEPKHLSIMLSRTDAPLKLDVRLRLEQLEYFLAAIHWPASAGQLAKCARQFVPRDSRVQLNLLVHPAMPSKLELEVFVDGDGTLDRRLVFLDELVRQGVADASKVEVLRLISEHPTSADVDGQTFGRTWYAKLRFEGASVEDAKAYVGVMPRILAPSATSNARSPSVTAS